MGGSARLAEARSVRSQRSRTLRIRCVLACENAPQHRAASASLTTCAALIETKAGGNRGSTIDFAGGFRRQPRQLRQATWLLSSGWLPVTARIFTVASAEAPMRSDRTAALGSAPRRWPAPLSASHRPHDRVRRGGYHALRGYVLERLLSVHILLVRRQPRRNDQGLSVTITRGT